MSDAGWFRDNGTLDNGEFRFDDVAPCRFRLVLMQDDTALATSDWHELLPGAQLHTGVLRTVPGGAVRVSITRGPGCETLAPELHFRREGAARGTTVRPGTANEFEVTNLTPGDYTVLGHAEGMLFIDARVTVSADVSTPLALTMKRGALVRFETFLPEGSKPSRYSYTVRDANGNKVHHRESIWRQRPTRPFAFAHTLRPGSYSVAISFELDSGRLAGSAEFSVGADLESSTVRLDPSLR